MKEIEAELRVLFVGRDVEITRHPRSVEVGVPDFGMVAVTSDGQLFLTHDESSPDTGAYGHMDRGEFVLDVLRAAGKSVLAGNHFWVLQDARDGVPAALAMILRGEV